MSEQLPPDEFDEIAQRGGPVGVHRAPRPWWARLVVPILAFVVAGAIAYLIAAYLWGREVNTPEESPTPTVTESVIETTTPTPAAEPSVTPSPTPSATETAVPVDFGAKIAVLNGAGISGLAAAQESKLEAAGFTDVTATNLTGSKPSANVVVYGESDMATTAAEVASELGISDVEQDEARGSNDVEVWLVTDPG